MSAQWTTSQIVGTVASAMALGAVCGVAFQAPAQTELYAPAATAVRTAIPAAPVTRMAAANQYVAEQTYEIPQEAQFAEFAEAEPVFVQAPAQVSSECVLQFDVNLSSTLLFGVSTETCSAASFLLLRIGATLVSQFLRNFPERHVRWACASQLRDLQ